MQPLVSCIVLICGSPVSVGSAGYMSMIWQLRNQTYKNLEIIPIACCVENLGYINDLVRLQAIEVTHNDTFDKCNLGLEKATGKYIGFFPSDDIYNSRFIELMVNTAEVTDSAITYCNFLSHYAQNKEVDGIIEMGHITTGSFLTRLADTAGIKIPMTKQGDIDWVLLLMEKQPKTAKVNEMLYIHL